MNYNKRWSPEEVETLHKLLAQKLSDTQIAHKLGRTQNSVSARINRMQRAGEGQWRTRGRALTIWTQDDEDLASKLWRDGMTASKVAKALDGRHSRNAVIGKMYRLGIETPNNQPVALKPKNPRPKRVAPPRKPTAEERVVRFHNDGLNVRDIASRQKVRKKEVVNMLVQAGLDPSENDTKSYKVNPCWSMNEDDRRMAFYTKFQAGWIEVLKRLEQPNA